MSFKIDGKTWVPQSASQHTEQIITKINTFLQENEIKDAAGQIVQLKQLAGNALYLLSLGDGNRFADNDAKLNQAINSFNVELCDDQQIENLLPIAAMTRNPGSYSTLILTVKADDSNGCTIPKGTKAPFNDVNFVVQEDVVISAGSTQNIETVCDTLGPIAVLTGEVSAFEHKIANVESVTNPQSSIPGTSAESTNELRQRIITGDTIKYSLNGVKNTLEELTGVNYARVYFNYNNSTTMELPGGVVIQPRTAYMVIFGHSPDIAKVYAEYMSAPTQNAPGASPTGTKTTVPVSITASSSGNAVIPEGASVSYDGDVFVAEEETTIIAGDTQVITFTATKVGAIVIPAGIIHALDEPVENVDTVINQAGTTGLPKTAEQQNFVTDSDQAIPVYYDDANEKKVFVKIVLKEDAESGTQVENQLKRDLILSSANWQIGESVTSLLTSVPFANCSYTDVAYTLVSEDGLEWSNKIDVGCNTIPRVSDAVIMIEQLVQPFSLSQE